MKKISPIIQEVKKSMLDVYIAGVGLTPFGKDFRPIGKMLADACRRALKDSESYTSRINPDCLVIGCMDPIGFARQTGLDSLVGIEMQFPRNMEIYHVERGSATGAAAIELGKKLASSGQKVLVCFGEKMKGKLRNEEIPTQISTVIDEEERERGLGEMPAVAALAGLEYMDVYRVSEKEFRNVCYEMSVRSLGYGALNDYAYFKKSVSREEYDDPEINRIIAEPLRKFDCSGSYNGAGAVYLVPQPTDVKLTAVKSAFDNIKITERKTLISLDAAVTAGQDVFREASLNPWEIDLCELHDAFKPVPWIIAEDLGFCPRGKGYRFVLEEKNKKDRNQYVNRSGGFLARTHPLGASGGAQLVELVWQLRGHAQYRDMFEDELPHLNYGLWFNMSGFGNTCIAGIVERAVPTRPREGLVEEEMPQPIPEKYIVQKKPRRDRVVASTRYVSPEDREVNVAIIHTREGEFRIGIGRESHPLKKGKYVKWIKPEEGPYFVRASVFREKLSGLLRILRRRKKK